MEPPVHVYQEFFRQKILENHEFSVHDWNLIIVHCNIVVSYVSSWICYGHDARRCELCYSISTLGYLVKTNFLYYPSQNKAPDK